MGFSSTYCCVTLREKERVNFDPPLFPSPLAAPEIRGLLFTLRASHSSEEKAREDRARALLCFHALLLAEHISHTRKRLFCAFRISATPIEHPSISLLKPISLLAVAPLITSLIMLVLYFCVNSGKEEDGRAFGCESGK